ncbi:MAG: cysteine desulfurase NifS [Candidatus Diapherotrites archaeon]
MKKIYMDHGATTPLDERVLKEMKPYFSDKFGNASSLHSFGREAAAALEKSRQTIAKALNAETNEIIFTSGGTESDNIALKGAAYANKSKGNHIITSAIEHHAVIYTCQQLEKEGFEVTYLPVSRDGLVDVRDLEKAITDKTILVSIMHANNEIGTIQPVKEIGVLCREKGVLFHTDAVQSFGKVPIDVKKMNIGLLSVSAHKIYGPKGVGALYRRNGTNVKALFQGGSHEFRLRPGTENVAGIVGLAKASELAQKEMKKEGERLSKMRDKLIAGVLESVGSSHLNGHAKKRLPNNANFSFDFIEGESLLMLLDGKGVAASTGSACSSKQLKPSHVLTSIGLSHVQAHGSLRLTLGKSNSMKDVDYVLKVLPPIVKKLRSYSPLQKGNVVEFEKMEAEEGHGHEHEHLEE